MHCHVCDGAGAMADFAKAGLEKNVHTLGFSSHAPVPFDCPWCMRAEDLEDYFTELSAVRANYPQLEIYAGLEIDYVPGLVSPNDFSQSLDYTIGSIHFVDEHDGKPWEIDGSHQGFLLGLNGTFKGNWKEAIVRYFELTREMVVTAQPDIVGHLDKIKIQNKNSEFYNEYDPWYQEQIDLTLKTILDAGCIVEVNTRGVYQKKSSTSYPGPNILTKILEYGIPITISSDAHNCKDLTSEFESTAKNLLTLGFKKMLILKDGSWQPVSLTPTGFV
jgi:histidinol-phosphatase (PHP family)